MGIGVSDIIFARMEVELFGGAVRVDERRVWWGRDDALGCVVIGWLARKVRLASVDSEHLSLSMTYSRFCINLMFARTRYHDISWIRA